MEYFSFQVTLTYVEAANVKNDHSDLRVDGLVLLVDQRAVIHLAVNEYRASHQLYYCNLSMILYRNMTVLLFSTTD